jgi:hypothetical protein
MFVSALSDDKQAVHCRQPVEYTNNGQALTCWLLLPVVGSVHAFNDY